MDGDEGKSFSTFEFYKMKRKNVLSSKAVIIRMPGNSRHEPRLPCAGHHKVTLKSYDKISHVPSSLLYLSATGH